MNPNNQPFAPLIQWYSVETMAAAVACNLPSFRNLLRQAKLPAYWKRGSDSEMVGGGAGSGEPAERREREGLQRAREPELAIYDA